MLAELVAYEGNDGDPQQRAQEIEDREALPGHAQNACERAGDHAQAEDEAREKNRDGAVAVEQSLAARNGFRLDAKCAAVTIKEAATSAIADQVPQVVSQGGRAHADHDDVGELQFLAGIRKQAGQQQDGFAGHGHAGIFEKQRHADGPVAILRDQVAQEIEDGLLLL